MDNAIINKIGPFLSLGMLTIFLLFIIFGLLFGLVRGVKRASLRLVLFVGLVLVTFFVTPLIVNGSLGWQISIAGRTPAEWVEYLSDELINYLQQQFGDYVLSFKDEIKTYAVAFVKAGLNLVLFYLLYIIIKVVSWFVYAVVAHFVAPKRDKQRKKLPKKAGLGALVGMVQGLILFTVFMFPLNGLIGVVNHAAEYQAQNQKANQTVTAQAITARSAGNNGGVDFTATLQKVNAPLKFYHNLMKYTGLQTLSNKAFEYQLTVKVENAETISLLHDMNSSLELYVDANSIMQLWEKLDENRHDGRLDLTVLNEADFTLLRQFINKAFDLQILNVADDVLGKLDEIFRAPYSDNLETLPGTEIYVDSIYGMLVKDNTTDRDFSAQLTADETNYTKYAAGLQALVKYLGGQGLDLVRKDLINVVDFLEVLDIYKVNYAGLEQPKTVAKILAQDDLGVQDYFDLSSARLYHDYGQYQKGEFVINVLGHRLTQFATIQMIGLKDLDSLLLYSKTMDTSFDNDPDLKTLVEDLIPMFLGEQALTHDGQKGYWEILGNDLVATAHVLRNYVNVKNDIEAEKTRLIAADTRNVSEDKKASKAQMQAILNYLSNLVVSEEEYNQKKDTDYAGKTYNKYQKIDDLADALYCLTNDFPPIKDFVIKKLTSMQTDEEGDYIKTLIEMLNKTEKSEWEKTLHNIVNVADVLNNSPLADVIDKVQDGTVENLAKDFVDAVKELDAKDVSDMLTGIMDIPEAGNIVKDKMGDVLDEVQNTDITELEAALGNGVDVANDAAAIKEQAAALKDELNKYGTDDANEDALRAKVDSLWDIIGKYKTNIPSSGE